MGAIMPTETQLMERIHAIESAAGVMTSQISELKESCRYLWESSKESSKDRANIRDTVGGIRVEMAKILGTFGVIQTIVTSVIVWKITH